MRALQTWKEFLSVAMCNGYSQYSAICAIFSLAVYSYRAKPHRATFVAKPKFREMQQKSIGFLKIIQGSDPLSNGHN